MSRQKELKEKKGKRLRHLGVDQLGWYYSGLRNSLLQVPSASPSFFLIPQPAPKSVRVCAMTFARSSLVFYAWLLLTLHAATVCANFHLGDYVPTARRGQFHGTRTSWHDALGRHAPRFGMDRTVAMPIPRPESFQPGDEYKLSLAFEGEHFVTPYVFFSFFPFALISFLAYDRRGFSPLPTQTSHPASF